MPKQALLRRQFVMKARKPRLRTAAGKNGLTIVKVFSASAEVFIFRPGPAFAMTGQ
jgi:hypothetical protein